MDGVDHGAHVRRVTASRQSCHTIAGATGLLVMAGAAAALAAPSDADAAWLASAHQSNLAEIAAGESAQRYTASARVRSAAAMLVEDHTALDADLRALAAELRVTLPAAATAAQRDSLAQVEAQSGAAYDAAWLALVIDGHAAALAGEQEVASGSDERVTALAAAAAPVVQHQYDRARSLSGAVATVPAGNGGQLATSDGALAGVLGGSGALLLAGSLVLVSRRRAAA